MAKVATRAQVADMPEIAWPEEGEPVTKEHLKAAFDAQGYEMDGPDHIRRIVEEKAYGVRFVQRLNVLEDERPDVAVDNILYILNANKTAEDSYKNENVTKELSAMFTGFSIQVFVSRSPLNKGPFFEICEEWVSPSEIVIFHFCDKIFVYSDIRAMYAIKGTCCTEFSANAALFVEKERWDDNILFGATSVAFTKQYNLGNKPFPKLAGLLIGCSE